LYFRAAAEINDKVTILREVVAQATAHADTAQLFVKRRLKHLPNRDRWLYASYMPSNGEQPREVAAQ
jgi:hypothetical protein